MKKIILILVIILSSFNIFAQETWEELFKKTTSFYEQGKYDEAVEYCLKTIDQAKKEYGENSIYYAATQDFLGLLYMELGNFVKAEPIFKEASKKFSELSGPNSLYYAQSLEHLGKLYHSTRKWDLAIKNYLESKLIYETNYSSDSLKVAIVNYNLAKVYFDAKQLDKAEKCFIDAILVYREELGQSDRNYINAVFELGALYKVKKEFKKAEPLYKELMLIYEHLYGENATEYAHTLGNYAEVKDYLGEHDIAEQYLKRALEIFEKFYGQKSQFYVLTLQKLARVANNKNDYDQSYNYWQQTLERYRFQIKYFFPLMNEQEKGKFYSLFKPYFEEFVSFVLKWKDKNPQLLIELYNNILLTKALLLNSTKKVRQQILNSGDQQLIDKFKNWLDLKEKLLRFYSLSKERLQKSKINIEDYEKKVDLIERELTKESEAFANSYSKKVFTWEDLKNSLNKDEAVIEIVRIRYFDNQWTDSVFYAYFITTKNSQLPKIILNTNGNMLENEYLHCYKNMIKHELFDYDSYNVYWKLVQENLDDSYKKIYVSLDGVYNLINLNTIQYPDGSYLLDSLSIVLINNSKKLIERNFLEKQISTDNNAVLFGAPDFTLDKSQELLSLTNNKENDEMSKFELDSLKIWNSFKMSQASSEIKKLDIFALPGTAVEIENITTLLQKKNWNIQKFVDKNAREKHIKSLKNPKILHIATHGYFLKDVEVVPDEMIFGFEAKEIFENPLLRSGLLFAGASYEIENDNSSEFVTNDNSILTAYEAMNLELDKTDLVVLSACETGLGEVQIGEGVYGLQRAFEVAGAKTIIMSLWKVNDITTQELMSKFYEEYLQTGNKYESFRKAQLYIKDRYRWPYFWGAFVIVGDE